MPEYSIKIGRNTKSHERTLKKLGYDVETDDDFILVQADGHLDEFTIEAESKDELAEKTLDFIRKLAEDNKVLTYKTKGTFEVDGDAEEHHSIFLCSKLEGLVEGSSAVVMKAKKKKRKGKSKHSLL